MAGAPPLAAGRPLFGVIDGATCGRAWSATAVRAELRHLASDAGVRRRFAPHQLRHAHAVELAREGVAVNIIQRHLGHTDLGRPRHIGRASNPARSSTRSDHADSRPFRPPPGSRSDRTSSHARPRAWRARHTAQEANHAAPALDGSGSLRSLGHVRLSEAS